MALNHFFAGVAVADYHAALQWYERLLGRPADVVVTDSEAMWQVVTSGWLYVVADPKRAGNALLTFLVDDLEGFASGLAARGIAVGSIDTLPGGMRKVVCVDPDGNTIAFGESPAI